MRTSAPAHPFELVVDAVPDGDALRADRLADHLLRGGIEPGGKLAIHASNRTGREHATGARTWGGRR